MSKGWRTWRENYLEELATEKATRKAFRVMTRMLNVQLSQGWIRWQRKFMDAKVVDEQRRRLGGSLDRVLRIFAGGDKRMLAVAWRSWQDVVLDLRQQLAATRKAFKVMTRVLNAQLARSWRRWYRFFVEEKHRDLRGVQDRQNAALNALSVAVNRARTAGRVFANAEQRMITSGWRAWRVNFLAQVAMEKAARNAFRVMARLHNSRLGKGWTRWRLGTAELRGVEHAPSIFDRMWGQGTAEVREVEEEAASIWNDLTACATAPPEGVMSPGAPPLPPLPPPQPVPPPPETDEELAKYRDEAEARVAAARDAANPVGLRNAHAHDQARQVVGRQPTRRQEREVLGDLAGE